MGLPKSWLKKLNQKTDRKDVLKPSDEPYISEAELHDIIAVELDYGLPERPKAAWEHCTAEPVALCAQAINQIPASNPKKRTLAAKLNKVQRQGINRGGWDITIYHPNVGVAKVEIKTKRGRLSDEQKHWGKVYDECGIPNAVCRSVDELKAFLKKHDIPLNAVLQ